jgi:hypothetical protein
MPERIPEIARKCQSQVSSIRAYDSHILGMGLSNRNVSKLEYFIPKSAEIPWNPMVLLPFTISTEARLQLGSLR